MTQEKGQTGPVGSMAGSGWVAFASVQLSKDERPYRFVNSMTLHWRLNVNENEMRGIAAEAALKEKPGFSIDSILVGIVPFPNAAGEPRPPANP